LLRIYKCAFEKCNYYYSANGIAGRDRRSTILTIHQFHQKWVPATSLSSLEQVEDILHSSSPTIVNRIEPQFREPSLYFAALVPGDEQSAELIKLLIRNGANANFKDHN
jgi:hypothetical protein